MRRSADMDEDEITAALIARNANRCQPPLDESEVKAIAKSAASAESQLPDYRTLRDLALSPGHLAVFVALLGEANSMGECSISYGALASKARVSVSTAQRATATLEGRGLVIPEYRPFRSRRYVIGDVSAVVAQTANVGPDVAQAQKLNQP